MIRIQLINEGKIVKQITSRVHESVMLEQVKQFKDTFDTIQIVEGELSEDAKSVLQHVARKIIPAAMAAGVAMGGANANAQGGANPHYPGMDRSIGQHISDIVSPRYSEIQRQRKYEQETQRKEWDAQQGELRQGRVDNARTAGRVARGATHYKLYDQSRISKDGKYFVIYGMDDKITRIPTAGTEFMAADSQRLAHYISPAGQVYYVRHPHNNGLGESTNESIVTEGVAETLPLNDALKLLRQYGAENLKTTSNELHFYKNGKPFSVDLVMNPDATRSASLSSLNAATRGLKGQGVAEGYSVTRGIDQERYQARAGLEGPFSTRSGKVVYYDPKEGKYYDPETDFYIDHEDYAKMDEDATVGTVGTIPASGTRPTSMTTKTKFNQTGSTTDVKFNAQGQLELDDELDANAVDILKKAGVEVAEATGLSPELSAILDQYTDSFEDFKGGGDITDNNDFYDALLDFFSDTNELPYDVATSGDPAEWISNKLNQIGGHQPMGESDEVEVSADQNIIMQIRRASDYEVPVPMELGDGSTIKIDSQTANKMLAQFNKLKPESKALMQQTLNTAEGFREMLNYFNEREVTESMADIDLISTHMKPVTEARLRAENLINSVFGK